MTNKSSQAVTERESPILFLKHRLFPTSLYPVCFWRTLGLWHWGGSRRVTPLPALVWRLSHFPLWWHLSMMFLLCLWNEIPQDVYTDGAHRPVLSGILDSEGISFPELLWRKGAGSLAVPSGATAEAHSYHVVSPCHIIGAMLNSLHLLSHFILIPALCGRYHYHHYFTNKVNWLPQGHPVRNGEYECLTSGLSDSKPHGHS